MSAFDLTNKMNNREGINSSSEEEYESRFDLDSIIEREGISGLVRLSKELYPNLKAYFDCINDNNRRNVTRRYIYEKFDAIRRFLNFESLFENTNPALPDETPKQRFLRYEEFKDDLKRRNSLLSQCINYSECFKRIKNKDDQEKVVILHLIAYDYLMDMSAFMHYVSLLEKTWWIRKKQRATEQELKVKEQEVNVNEQPPIQTSSTSSQEEAQNEEISQSEQSPLDNLDTFMDKLASEYAGHIRQFCNDEHLLKQGLVNLYNLVNSSFKEKTSKYLRVLEEEYEFTDKIINHSVENLKGERAQKPLHPSYFSSAILKSHETPFIVQWEQEKDFRGKYIEIVSLAAIFISSVAIIMLGSIHLNREIIYYKETLSFPVALGLSGAMCYITGVLIYEGGHKLNKWLNEINKNYMARNEPLIERIINDRKVFEVYNQ